MSLSSPAAPGLIGNAAAGYRLAWVHRRQVLSVLLPVLASAMIGLLLIDLLLGRDHMVLVNDVPVVPGDGNETLVWARSALVMALWLLALPAATLTVAAATRGHAVRPKAALVAAARISPVFAAGMVAVGGVTLLLLRAAVGVAGAAGSRPMSLILVAGALLVAGVLAARMLIGVVAHPLGGSGRRLTSGRVVSTAGAFLLGGVAVPLFVAHLSEGLLTAGTAAGSIAARLIGAVLVTGLVAVQAGILAHVCLLHPEESTDLAAVDARLAELAGGTPRLPWLAVAATATVIAVLAPTGVAVANPFDAPAVRSHEDAPTESAAVAWPAGRHPVIATMTGARFCDNDGCDRFVNRNGGPAVMDGHGSAGISADGDTVVKAVLTGGADSGGPFIHYARCRRDGCRQAWLPARASAREPFGWPEMAAAVAPDQAIWFVLAMPSAPDAPGKATYQLTFVRCADIGCAKPQRHRAGTVERTPDDGTPDQQHAQLSIGADGRPIATIRTGMAAVLVTCDPVTCAAPRTTRASAGPPGVAWLAPTTATGPVVSFDPGTLRIGDQTVALEGAETVPWSGALAVSGSHVYVTAAEATTRPGVHVTLGEPTEASETGYFRQVLWRCDQSGCRRQILDASESMIGRETLAVAADGRVLIVRQERILLVSAPA